MTTAAHILQELSSEKQTFRAAIENLHGAEKTASKNNLAFQKIIAVYQNQKFLKLLFKHKHSKLLNKNASELI